jgi:hypothetical protein
MTKFCTQINLVKKHVNAVLERGGDGKGNVNNTSNCKKRQTNVKKFLV